MFPLKRHSIMMQFFLPLYHPHSWWVGFHDFCTSKSFSTIHFPLELLHLFQEKSIKPIHLLSSSKLILTNWIWAQVLFLLLFDSYDYYYEASRLCGPLWSSINDSLPSLDLMLISPDSIYGRRPKCFSLVVMVVHMVMLEWH